MNLKYLELFFCLYFWTERTNLTMCEYIKVQISSDRLLKQKKNKNLQNISQIEKNKKYQIFFNRNKHTISFSWIY